MKSIFLKRIERPLNQFIDSSLKIEKRIRFVMSTLILSGIMLISTVFFFDKAWVFIPTLLLASYFFTFFSVLESIEKIEWITLFMMPVLFSIAMYIFYFLFPVRWITRAPFIGFFAISTYALFLTSNIFNVGVEKSLRLYKAAYSVNFLYQTILAFLLFSIFFSLKEWFFINGIGCGVVGFLLALHLLWTIRLNLTLDRETLLYAGFIGFMIGQVAIVVSFLPLTTSVAALFLTASYYSFGGMFAALLNNSLFRNVVREYLLIIIIVGIVAFLSLSGW